MKFPKTLEEFGASVEEIVKAKTSGEQRRDFLPSEAPTVVTLSAEECRAKCKEIGVTYEKGYEERVLSYVCSDESVDRMGDIIKQDGWDLENFKKNPVIMANHNYGEFPVGNALSVKVVNGKLKMDILFANKDVSEKADQAFKLAKTGFMKAGSVGFMPKEYHQATAKEQEELGMSKFGLMFEKQELLEYSVCGVPANANALQESISKGLFTKRDLENFVEKDVLDEIKEEKELENQNTDVSDSSLQKKVDEMVSETIGKHLEAFIELKQGAVLSKKNKNSIKSAIAGMEGAVASLKELLASVDPEESNTDKDKEKSTNTDTLKKEGTFDIDLDALPDQDEGEDLYGEDTIVELELN